MRACRDRGPGFWTAFLAVLLAVPMAYAYQLIQTPGGEAAHWDTGCLYYSIHEDGAPGMSFEAARKAIRQSFDAWEAPACSYFRFMETDPAQCVRIGFNLGAGNMNLLVWVTEDWSHTPEAMALTTVSYDQESGRILDADVEFNSEIFSFGVEGGVGIADVRNTATHEIGHMVGIDHSGDAEATMYGMAFPGETNKRDLSKDDEDGLCRLYPIEVDPESCDEPACGLDLTCESEGCDGSGGDDCTQVAPGSEFDASSGIETVARLAAAWLAATVASAW